ncbi:thioredoxin-dependent thiol peroxidase [Paenibacillus aurantius]|uniref:thioredoxin-dependent peroxiredoxin n=1 Tax=Paenibacillus aurantius TaxID=2918900 RepID=A0AA96LHG6_9BACL|nr:thioredoxin-dependent thiol peroxidase [Paenibacillus aurantius]WNQ12140.1 thioredoxin-dependent thiol peroxidase [Paenibacillus aurantius]
MTNAQHLQEGQPIPDFKLQASNGKSVSLEDFRGKKLVIYFYPADMTPTCTQESCDFRDLTPQIRKAGAEIIGISPDDLKSHGRFIEKHQLPFLLLSDPEHRVCESFGVWQLKKMFGREYMGVERSTFLVDGEGKLIKAWRKVKVKNHAQDVLDAVNGS